VNRFISRIVIALLLLQVAVAASGQNWPLPSKNQNVEVACSKCTGASPPADGKTVGYAAPIAAFTGRVVDSQSTNDIQYPLRTLRAGKMGLSPDGRRLYMIQGGLLAAYDTGTLFTRLASGEQLMPSTSIPLSILSFRAGAPEVVLRPDRFFNAEWGSPWTCPYVDGQARLNDFDVDDQGYVYLSHYVFGWGIVKDDLQDAGGLALMESQYQHFPYGDNGDQDPVHIVSFRSGADYYALTNVETQSEIWKVTDRTHPVRVSTLPRMNFSQAAKNAAGDRLAIMDGSTGAISVYATSTLATGNVTALATFSPGFPWVFASVTSDGTNFFGAFTQPTLKIAVMTPSGSSFVESAVYDTGVFVDGAAIRANAGYLTVITPNGLLLYKVGSTLGFTPVALKSSQAGSYFPQYYYNFAPPGYGYPHFYVHGTDAAVIKSGGKSYLLYTAGGLADVYELQTGDGISIAQLGSTGTLNLNVPASERVKMFYGDPIGFTATTTAPAPMTINWNFGNAEAVTGADPNIAPPPAAAGQTGPGTVTHRYSGIGTAAGLTPRTVTVTNTLDTSIFATSSVTLQPPQGRIGIVGFSDCTVVPAKNCFDHTFVQAGPTQPLPIVAGDKWFDASDGSLEGHSDSWTFTPAPPPPLSGPQVTPGVGQCGTYNLLFGAHYGQNGTLLTQTDYTAPTGGLQVLYSVKPFASYVTVSSAALSPTITFTNATRFGDPSILTPTIKAALVYKWELVNSAGGTTAGPTGDYATTATWAVPKSQITRGMVARLTVTSSTDFAAPCAGFTTSAYSTAPLNAPDPVINGSCTTSPCTLTAASLSGADPVAAGWTYQWSVSGTSLSGTGQSFIATFPSTGSYTVTVTATNNVGSAQATKQVSVIVQICALFTPNVDVFITYNGPNSLCTQSPLSAQCNANEAVQFNVSAFQYNLSCGPHTFTWDFGDGGTGSGQSATHAFAVGSSYTVKCAVTDTSSGNVQTLTQTVNVQTAVHIDPCSPGMTSASVFIAYATNSGSCSNGTGGTCATSETIFFSAGAFGYNFACGSHTFFWNFGDGTTSTTQNPTHAFSTANTYPVTLSITGPDNSISLSASVKVGTSVVLCPPMVANNNVFISDTDGNGTSCISNQSQCLNGLSINFAASSLGYNFGCGAHTYSWNFGDGGTATGSPVTHTFATANTYNVVLTIANQGQTLQVPASVVIGSANKVTPVNSVDFSVTPWRANGVVIPNGYEFTPESDPAGVVTTWTWDFNDNLCPAGGCKSTAASPVIQHLFPSSSNYSITLTGTTSDGHQATVVHLLFLVPPHRRSASH
jgi:PKD repeat protein